MIVLVDYDNVPELERSRGPVHVISRIVDAIDPHLPGETELRCRLYGGWFQGPQLSRRAQQIVPILRADFPRPMSASQMVNPTPLMVRAELAFGLEAAPKQHITHTYRERALPQNIRCASLPYNRCGTPANCPIAPMHALLRDSQCPELGCTVDVASVLTKPEQKLVDTMLTVDVVHLARATTETIAVVSADDDLWPGIQAALLYGAKIVHVHTLPGRKTPAHYSTLATGHYHQVSL